MSLIAICFYKVDWRTVSLSFCAKGVKLTPKVYPYFLLYFCDREGNDVNYVWVP